MSDDEYCYDYDYEDEGGGGDDNEYQNEYGDYEDPNS